MKHAIVVVGAVLVAVVGHGQTSNLTGTWTLDAARSRIDPDAVLSGLIAAGVPERLHLTQPANGTLVIESEINESYARIYRPGKTTSTPVFLGQAGKIVMTSRWEDGKLVSEGRRELASDTSAPTAEVEEIIAPGASGQTMEISITVKDGDGARESRATYTRTSSVGPCESWATPCKYPSN